MFFLLQPHCAGLLMPNAVDEIVQFFKTKLTQLRYLKLLLWVTACVQLEAQRRE